MHRLTILQRLLVVALAPLAAFVGLQQFADAPWLQLSGYKNAGAIIVYVAVIAFAIAFVLWVARSLSRRLTDATETIDAMTTAEMDAPVAPSHHHGEIERLLVAIDRLADLMK